MKELHILLEKEKNESKRELQEAKLAAEDKDDVFEQSEVKMFTNQQIQGFKFFYSYLHHLFVFVFTTKNVKTMW